MITATIEGDEIKTTGEIEEGDNYPDFCCAGYRWEVVYIASDVWGICNNPDCPESEPPYQGVKHVDLADLAEWLAKRSD